MVRFTTALMILAGMVIPNAATAQSEQVFYYHTDAVGSIRLITDANGQEVVRNDPAPFGEDPAPVQNVRRFAGAERDAETKFDYFGARHYTSGNGRFTTPDPYNASAVLALPQSWNAYAYALNNPLRYIDPNGESPTLVSGAVGFGFGFLFGAGTAAVSAYRSGADLSDLDTWQSIAAQGLGGGVFGGGIGLTGGMSLLQTGAIATVASVAGGAATRVADGSDSTAPGDAFEIAGDALSGAAGGAAGHYVQSLLRARIGTPEFLKVLGRQADRARRVASNGVPRSAGRQAARDAQARDAARVYQYYDALWLKLNVLWPAAGVRSGTKRGVKGIVTTSEEYRLPFAATNPN